MLGTLTLSTSAAAARLDATAMQRRDTCLKYEFETKRSKSKNRSLLTANLGRRTPSELAQRSVVTG